MFCEKASRRRITGDVDKAFGGQGVQSARSRDRVSVPGACADGAARRGVRQEGTTGRSTSTPARSFPAWTRTTAAKILGLDPAKVRLNTQLAGGSFGRRAQFGSPYMQEAAEVFARRPTATRPVKHMWTREDDMRGGFYRPMYVHKMSGAIDADGRSIAWDQTIVGQSIMGKASTDRRHVGRRRVQPALRDRNLRVISHNISWRYRRSGGARSATRIRALRSRPSSTNCCRRSARTRSRAGWRF